MNDQFGSPSSAKLRKVDLRVLCKEYVLLCSPVHSNSGLLMNVSAEP